MATVTDFVAGYGAVLSTIVAIYGIYVALRDKGRLKLNHDFEHKKSGGLNAIKFYVANVGRRPVKLKHWAIGKPGTEPIAVTSLDYMLPESDSKEFYVVEPGLILPWDVDDIFDITNVFVKDSSVKEWRITREAREEIEEGLRKGLKRLDEERE